MLSVSFTQYNFPPLATFSRVLPVSSKGNIEDFYMPELTRTRNQPNAQRKHQKMTKNEDRNLFQNYRGQQ